MSEATKGVRSSRDRIARLVDAGLPTFGVFIVLAAVVLGGGGWGAIWMAVAGLLLVEAGVWRLGSRVMHERRYLPLRREVGRFTGLARDLHHATTAARASGSPEARAELDRTLAAMRASLDRMAAVAGRTEAELAGGDVGPGEEPGEPGGTPAARAVDG